MTEAENLTKWRHSGDPHRWVWQRNGVWCVQEYAGLLATLRAGPFWPMREQEIEKTLEAAAETFHDLKRCNLLGDQGQGFPYLHFYRRPLLLPLDPLDPMTECLPLPVGGKAVTRFLRGPRTSV